MKLSRHIFLIGFMGCGKSTVSRRLAEECDVKCMDTDVRISDEQGMTISDIFEQKGEVFFRELETELLKKLGEEEPKVIACGGGMATFDRNIAIMKECGTVVLLMANPETIFERVRYGKNRPLLEGNMNVEYITELMNKRTPYYDRAADVTVVTDGRTPMEIVQKIVEKLNDM
ncbi:MAG: shikimate kinase [Lachnospiraceae bacterium]|nr:shikimate kinase [Lachnospiraceae bacterium]